MFDGQNRVPTVQLVEVAASHEKDRVVPARSGEHRVAEQHLRFPSPHQLAQRKPVSRQAMQAVLDGLVAKGLVRIDDNPRHKRSKLYRLAPQGIDLCVELQRREIAAIRELMDEGPDADFAAAAAALQTLNRLLARKLKIG